MHSFGAHFQEYVPLILVSLGVIAMVGILLLNLGRGKRQFPGLTPGQLALMEEHVGFYRTLIADRKPLFIRRMENFLHYVRVHGVKIPLEDLDVVLVAASSVIPAWGFKEWKYNNLSDVLLYGEAFDSQHFAGNDSRHNVLGMVGSGAMERVMILSRPALRDGFSNVRSTFNTGIHEFVHLIDKSDGAVDGIPEALLGEHVKTWTTLMRSYMGPIRSGQTDIYTYAATNPAEFFAVVAEYFFKRPDLMEARHPDLFALLSHIFRQKPALDPKVAEEPVL